jgi:phage major head subunit gpT-like protein
MDSSTDQNVFMKKQFLYGVDCRDNAGFGLWQMAYGSTGETA